MPQSEFRVGVLRFIFKDVAVIPGHLLGPGFGPSGKEQLAETERGERARGRSLNRAMRQPRPLSEKIPRTGSEFDSQNCYYFFFFPAMTIFKNDFSSELKVVTSV